MQQLLLKIGPALEPDFDNYVAGPNAEALAAVRAFAARSREAVMYLWGDPGSGRTHLLRAAAKANPDAYWAFIFRGNVYAKLGRKKEAEADYREALARNPGPQTAAQLERDLRALGVTP